MGLTSRAHRTAVAVELAGLLSAALVIGGILAFGAVALVYRRLDPLPGLPPAPILEPPLALLAWVGLAVLVCAWVGAALVQWRAERVTVGTVLRLAE